jgi:hypothetical protein
MVEGAIKMLIELKIINDLFLWGGHKVFYNLFLFYDFYAIINIEKKNTL